MEKLKKNRIKNIFVIKKGGKFYLEISLDGNVNASYTIDNYYFYLLKVIQKVRVTRFGVSAQMELLKSTREKVRHISYNWHHST